ncbi:MAG: hypothetical protein NTZ10_03780 [Candidatus Saganbacteria bacterium]|nr:hypothetical protein [Candidatus Saganbacteria bacterium]
MAAIQNPVTITDGSDTGTTVDCSDFTTATADQFMSAADFDAMDSADGFQDGIVTENGFKAYLSSNNIDPSDYRVGTTNSNIATSFNTVANPLKHTGTNITSDDLKITRDEWTSYQLPKLTVAGLFTNMDFTTIDTNHDGVINASEWAATTNPLHANTTLFNYLAARSEAGGYVINAQGLNAFVADAARFNSGNYGLADIVRIFRSSLDANGNGGIKNSTLTSLGITAANITRFTNSNANLALGTAKIIPLAASPTIAQNLAFTNTINTFYKNTWNSDQVSSADFTMLDANGDMKISKDELYDFVSTLGINKTRAESDQMFDDIRGTDADITLSRWNIHVNINNTNRANWNQGIFTSADFGAIDVDGDGKISMSDWVGSNLPITNLTGTLSRLYSYLNSGDNTIDINKFMFALTDTNSDGVIDFATEWSSVIGTSPAPGIVNSQNLLGWNWMRDGVNVLATPLTNDGVMTLAELVAANPYGLNPLPTTTSGSLISQGQNMIYGIYQRVLALDTQNNDVARGLAGKSASVYLPGLGVYIDASDGLDASELFQVGQSSNIIETTIQALTLIPQKLDAIAKAMLKYAQP